MSDEMNHPQPRWQLRSTPARVKRQRKENVAEAPAVDAPAAAQTDAPAEARQSALRAAIPTPVWSLTFSFLDLRSRGRVAQTQKFFAAVSRLAESWAPNVYFLGTRKNLSRLPARAIRSLTCKVLGGAKTAREWARLKSLEILTLYWWPNCPQNSAAVLDRTRVDAPILVDISQLERLHTMIYFGLRPNIQFKLPPSLRRLTVVGIMVSKFSVLTGLADPSSLAPSVTELCIELGYDDDSTADFIDTLKKFPNLRALHFSVAKGMCPSTRNLQLLGPDRLLSLVVTKHFPIDLREDQHANLSALRALQRLRLLGGPLKDNTLSGIRHLPSLRSLTLDDYALDDSDYHVLAALPSLQTLCYGSDNNDIDPAHIPSLPCSTLHIASMKASSAQAPEDEHPLQQQRYDLDKLVYALTQPECRVKTLIIDCSFSPEQRQKLTAVPIHVIRPTSTPSCFSRNPHAELDCSAVH